MVIGRYRLRQIIGRGGSSVVYRAINDDRRDLPSVVAVKVADRRAVPRNRTSAVSSTSSPGSRPPSTIPACCPFSIPASTSAGPYPGDAAISTARIWPGS